MPIAKIECYDHNGAQRPTTVQAESLDDAKQQAWDYADGTTNRITLTYDGVEYHLLAMDMFLGFCSGVNEFGWNS